jgi:hypothetical protein
MDYTPIILKNKGIACEVAKVKQVEPQVWEREYDEVGETQKETVFVRFSNNIISDIEDHWGSLDLWQQALEARPVSTLRQTLSYSLKKPIEAVGEMMLEGQTMHYSNAVGVAWALANGVDPTVASRMLKQSAELAEEQKRLLNEAISKNNQEMENSPGKSGTQPGVKRAARTKSSGS